MSGAALGCTVLGIFALFSVLILLSRAWLDHMSGRSWHDDD